MRATPSFTVSTPSTTASRRRRLGAAATVATLALGSALAGAAVGDARLAPDAAGEASPTAPSVAFSFTVHGEERRDALRGGGARFERVRTVRFSWRSR